MAKSTQFSSSQMTRLRTNINIAVAMVLPEVVAKFEPNSLLKAIKERRQFLADKLGPAFEQILKSLFTLETLGRTSINVDKKLNPGTFFRSRSGSGLCVTDSFQGLVVANAKSVKIGTVIHLDHGLLAKNMFDAEIEAVLLNEHLFDDSIVCAAIQVMITKQKGGKEGRLLSDGHFNLFYLSSWVVFVRWIADGRKWDVDAYRRGDIEWPAGTQVFSLVTTS